MSLFRSIPIILIALSGHGLAAPANDNIADATVLSGTQAISAAISNQTATLEPGEPKPSGNYTRSLWWSWTAPANGRVTFDTVGSDTGFNKVLRAYVRRTTAVSVANLAMARSIGGTGNVYTAPSMTLAASAGTVYYIVVASDSASSSEYGSVKLSVVLNVNDPVASLNVQTQTLYNNDNFASRVRIQTSDSTSIGYAWENTREAQEPIQTGGGSVWWRYTAPADGRVTLATTGSVPDYTSYPYENRLLTVWTGSTLATLSPVASHKANEPSVSFNATGGQTYFIAVGDDGTNSPGTVVLTLHGPLPPPVPDIEISSAVKVRWPTVTGTTYYLRSSTDLINWTKLGSGIAGDGTVKESYQPVTPNARFFRVYPE